MADWSNKFSEKAGGAPQQGGSKKPSINEGKNTYIYNVYLFRICAVCTFGLEQEMSLAVGSKTLKKVHEEIEFYGGEDESFLMVFEDDSTEEAPIDKEVDSRFTQTERLKMPDMGTIVFMKGYSENQEPRYMFAYVLMEELDNLLKALNSQEEINVDDYFAKVLYEGLGEAVNPKDLADIGSAYKIYGDKLTLILA